MSTAETKAHTEGSLTHAALCTYAARLGLERHEVSSKISQLVLGLSCWSCSWLSTETCPRLPAGSRTPLPSPCRAAAWDVAHSSQSLSGTDPLGLPGLSGGAAAEGLQSWGPGRLNRIKGRYPSLQLSSSDHLLETLTFPNITAWIIFLSLLFFFLKPS